MKKILLTGLLTWISLVAGAQTYYLDLSNQQLNVPGRAVAVEHVLDGRAGQPIIGLVYRGLGDKSATVLFRYGLGPELTTFVQAQLPARPTDHPILLCLRQLRVGETLDYMGEQAKADLAADVYVHLPDGYHFVQSVAAHTSARGLETTYLHAGHVALLLSKCLTQLAQADWKAAAAQKALPLAALASDVPVALAGGARQTPPILREAPRRGIYYRFEQFLANRPDTSLAFHLDTIQRHFESRSTEMKWLGVARVRPLVRNKSGRFKEPKDIWGFSDGQQIFMQHNWAFFSLMRQGSFFSFVGEAPVDQLHAMAVAQAQGRAQLTGIAWVGVPDHTAEPLAYALNMRTGEVANYLTIRPPARIDTAYIYVYRSAEATGTIPVKVFVEGHEMGSLRPGEYIELPWSRYARPLELCLGGLSVAKPCQYLVPNIAQLNYLRINPASAARRWEWVPPAQGAADLDELDKRHK